MSAPSTPLSARPSQKKNSAGRSHSCIDAHTVLARKSSAVSTMRNRLSPSTPSL